MSLDDITNFLEISDRLGTAGQPTREQFSQIRAAGYEALINLAMPDSINALPDEAGLVALQKMEYIHIPVIWTDPSTQNLEEFFAAMKRLEGRKIFAHCALNYRVSSFVYLYRVTCLAANAEEAWWDVLSIWEPDTNWSKFIRDSLEKLHESGKNPV
jgi:protein tyrosine phosphatase (PTP) superfamily phosphohydrolase (DUF442 family)